MKYCLKCGEELEKDDNFCAKCGHWTAKGYIFLHDKNNKKIINGKIVKEYNRLSNLFVILFFSTLLVIGITIYRGQSILKPFVYTKRQIMNYKYGYNTTILKTDNQYFNQIIPNKDIAREKIKEDFTKQKWECKNNIEVGKVEKNLEEKYNIISVDFCDIPLEEAKKLATIIDNIYISFPNIKNYLTNISVTNSKKTSDFIAYFQPIYQFINTTNEINNHNKVNKTQILLNSYYFINNDNISKPIKDNWYVKDANWESLIAHEFGHYILFASLLKSKGIDNVMFVTKENEATINSIINIVNNQIYSKEKVTKALNNYNNKYQTNYSILDFAKLISNYAASTDNNNTIIYDEIIAEAIHDYYLHKNNASKASLEIIKDFR